MKISDLETTSESYQLPSPRRRVAGESLLHSSVWRPTKFDLSQHGRWPTVPRARVTGLTNLVDLSATDEGMGVRGPCHQTSGMKLERFWIWAKQRLARAQKAMLLESLASHKSLSGQLEICSPRLTKPTRPVRNQKRPPRKATPVLLKVKGARAQGSNLAVAS